MNKPNTRFTKREVIIALVFLLIGVLASYIYSQNELKQYKRVGFKIMDNCIQTMKVADDLSKNCSQAYKIVGVCVSNLNVCDVVTEANKLDVLNRQKIEIENELWNLTEQSGSLINAVNETIKR